MTVPVQWRKSSRSGEDTACIEVANTLAAVRDSKNPGGPYLRGSVAQLVNAVRIGRLDR